MTRTKNNNAIYIWQYYHNEKHKNPQQKRNENFDF